MQMFQFLAPLVGFAAVAAAGAEAGPTTTIVVTDYTTYCPEPTTLIFKNKTITVTEATTLTITDCPCTLECYTPPIYTTTSHGTVPYANKTTHLPPVIITVTPTVTTVLQDCTTITSKTVTKGGQTTVETIATTKVPGPPPTPTTVVPVPPTTTVVPVPPTTTVVPVPPTTTNTVVTPPTTTPVVVPTTTGPPVVVTAGANKAQGVAALGLAVGMAAPPKGEKTNWVMHEYRLEGKFSYHRLPKNCKDEWVVCRIFQKSAGGKKTSIGLLSRNSYLDLPGSPSLPSLLESPYNAAALNDQETGSIESESGTNSAKAHVSCFSTAMEYPRANFTGHHLHQYQRGNSSNYPDSSDQLSEMARLMKQSSYMHNFMLNDPRIHMNMMPATALFSLSNMRRDNISAMLDHQPGIQQLPVLPPPLLYNPHMPLPSNSSNMGFPQDVNISTLHPSKALVSQSAGSSMEPSSSSGLHHRTLSNDNTMGANNSVANFQWNNDGLSQKILSQPIQDADGAQCMNPDMNDEMTSVVCNRLDRPLDQLDTSGAPPVDFDSLWNIREHLF